MVPFFSRKQQSAPHKKASSSTSPEEQNPTSDTSAPAQHEGSSHSSGQQSNADPNRTGLLPPSTEPQATTHDHPASLDQRAHNHPAQAIGPQNSSQTPTPGAEDAVRAPSGQHRFSDAVARWKSDLAELTSDHTADNLPRYTLGNAHPGGLAQLYAHHPTRLENLVREPAAYTRALEACRHIISRQDQLAAQHGMAPIHLAVGYVSWQENGVKKNSPALLRPVSLHDEGDHIVLTLGENVQVAPVFQAYAADYGIQLSAQALQAEAGVDAASFSPTRAFNYLRAACQSLPDLSIRDDLALGMYEHPAARLLRELERGDLLAESAIVRALAGDKDIQDALLDPLPEANPFDRDPWAERGIGDLTPQQHDIIEAAAAGRSFVIHGQQSSNNALLAAIIAEAAAKGRTTVHVAGGRSRLGRAHTALRNAGIDHVVTQLDGSAQDASRMREGLRQALAEEIPGTVDPSIEQLRTDLRNVRHTLSSYINELHAPFGEFGVSAMDALQVLTDMTSRTSAPRTKIRLRSNVLVDIARDQGEAARSLLHRAADLGMFSREAAHSAWTGVVINAPEQVEVVLTSVRRLATEILPQLRNDIQRIASEAQLAPAGSVRQWQAQLQMLQGVREALDVFKPEIFERSAADMVIATASAQWRQEHGLVMKRAQRNRLMKHAKDLLLPGRHVADLHRELLLVQEKREIWRHFSSADGWPVLPRGLQESASLTAQVSADLDTLLPAFSTGFTDLYDMPLDELQRLLDRLSADPHGAELLPQRVAVLKDASAMGIDQLLTDLRRRHVSPDMIDVELDLSWWASVLGVILASDEAFRGMDPLRLSSLLQQSCDLDAQQVSTLLPQAITNMQRRRQQAMNARADQFAAIETFLDAAEPDPFALYQKTPLVPLLLPAVLTLPTLVPLLVPSTRPVDLLILDDVAGLPLAELVPLIARARQVLVFSHEEPKGATAQLAHVLPLVQVNPRPSRLNDQVLRLLSFYGTPHMGVPRPEALRTDPLAAVWVQACGMPTPGASAIESTAAEVDAVIEVILDHVSERPSDSLAVIALNEVHALRVREGVARAIAQDPSLRAFFDPSRVEPFVVADPSQAANVRRDHIILAVGFAKTPHGRVLHDFGVFSRPEGAAAMARILSCVREDLTVVSSLKPGEIDRDRLSATGAHMLVDILATAEGHVEIAPGSWPVLEAEPDRLLLDLAERLYAMGLEVIPNVGVQGGIRIPLAIGHPAIPERMLIAVLTDDAQYMAEPSLRVRDRLVPQLLRDQGWVVLTAMSLEVFIDPGAVAQRIADAVFTEVDRIQQPVVDEAPVAPVVHAELAPEEQAALDATNEARARHDEALTGMIQIITAEASKDLHSADVSVDVVVAGGLSPDGRSSVTTDPASANSAVSASPSPLGATYPSKSTQNSGQLAPGAGGHDSQGSEQAENAYSALTVSDNSTIPTFEDLISENDADNLPQPAEASINAGGAAPKGLFAQALAQWNQNVDEAASNVQARAPRPAIARGLPLAAYGDDQLDELAMWIRSDNIPRTHEELVEELRATLRLTRRGTQTDAVLANVIRRTEPVVTTPVGEASAGTSAQNGSNAFGEDPSAGV